eukprot:2872367-Rhodomonas_salina.1
MDLMDSCWCTINPGSTGRSARDVSSLVTIICRRELQTEPPSVPHTRSGCAAASPLACTSSRKLYSTDSESPYVW